jgi:hypothetical protein
VCFCNFQLVAEVERLKNVNVYSKIATFMTSERSELIIKATRGRKAGAELLKSVGNSSNLDLNSTNDSLIFLHGTFSIEQLLS